MSTVNEIVAGQFEQSQTYAQEAIDLAETFLNTFAENLFTAPLVDVEWDDIVAPTVEDVPDAPVIAEPTLDLPDAPAALDLAAPDVTIDDFTELAPSLTIPEPPEVVIGDAPTVADITDIVVPDAPTVDAIATPTYLDLATPTFSGVDLQSAYLTDLKDNAPTFDLVDPTLFTYTPGAAYTSGLKTALSTLLADRVANGGTGLPAAVEALIWGRASDRESATAQDGVDEAMTGFQNLGWVMPNAQIAASVRKARQNMRNRIADLSREVAVKQAEMEQKNIQHAIEQGVQWEGKLIDYSYNLERMAFETAKVVAENAIAVYNAVLEAFKGLVQLLQVRISIYDSIIKGELAKVDVFKAEIAAEQAKADANRTIVEQFKAQIEASLGVVRVYEAQVQGARARIELERTKVEASAEQIRGFVAGVNGQTAKVELFKAQVQGQTALAGIFETKARAFQAKVGGQEAKARAELARFAALQNGKEAEVRAFTARVDAERTRVMALSEIARVLLASYEAQTRTVEAKNNLNARLFEARSTQYRAKQEYIINGQKINSDIISHNRATQLDASKAGAQIIAQLAGSALGAAHAQAGISAAGNMSVGYNYSNQTATSPAAVTAV